MGLSPEPRGNAIQDAATPTIDYLLQNYPSVRLLASGTEVGLDMGEPGNSEVGHLALGTGQVLPQAFQMINSAIKSEAYKKNKAFLEAFEQVKKNPTATLHLVGMVSSGGVHGHLDHMIALLELAREKKVRRVAIHAITDGRDSPPQVVLQDLQKLLPAMKGFEQAVIASVGGRFYAMDRDTNWERTDAFYWAMLGKAPLTAPSVEQAVNAAYGRGETDETIQPTVITNDDGTPLATIQQGDAVILTNYRPDRIRQITLRIMSASPGLLIVTMTNYFLADHDLPLQSGSSLVNAFPLPKPTGTLAMVLAQHHISQLHIAETEKYAHITYFFNGHEEQKQPLEDWLLVPSVKVSSFDQSPAMSAAAITAAYLQAKAQHPADFTTLNYANMDMVGHTGNFEATKQAVTFVDAELKKVIDWVEAKQEWLLLTADHGNAEQMINPATGEADKEHTTNPVPFILVHPSLKKMRDVTKNTLANTSAVAMLADVAPTILAIMGVPKPREMVGSSLLTQMTS
jgi:2,3-bisphosphoglycerate-independent phosphoglycerate mutase